MTDEYLDGIMNRDNPDKKKDNVPYLICPINMYFEGDEDKCDVTYCDFNLETRSCTNACKIDVKELQKEIDRIKPQPEEGILAYTINGKIRRGITKVPVVTVVTPLILIDNEIFDAKGRLIAKVWREDVGEALLVSLNSQPDLLTACENALPLISGMRIANDAFKPVTDLEKHLGKLIRKSEEELETVIAKVEKKGDKSG